MPHANGSVAHYSSGNSLPPVTGLWLKMFPCQQDEGHVVTPSPAPLALPLAPGAISCMLGLVNVSAFITRSIGVGEIESNDVADNTGSHDSDIGDHNTTTVTLPDHHVFAPRLKSQPLPEAEEDV